MRAVVEERNFISRLLELAKTVSSGEFNSREITAVERYLCSKEPNEDYFVALTLLPRLIAIADPQLPIIVFSSTGQRVIMARSRNTEISLPGLISRDFSVMRPMQWSKMRRFASKTQWTVQCGF